MARRRSTNSNNSKKRNVIKKERVILLIILFGILSGTVLTLAGIINIKKSPYDYAGSLSNSRIWDLFLHGESGESGTNLVVNPSFEEGMEGWNTFGTGIKQIENIEGNNLLYIENTNSDQIGVVQKITFSEPGNNSFYISYRAKLEEINSPALASLNIKADYSNGSYSYFLSPFSLTEGDRGVWTKKEYVFHPSSEIENISVYIMNYYAKSKAYYDDIEIIELDESTGLEIGFSDSSKMFLNKYGFVDSLQYQSQELLKSKKAISRICNDSECKESINITFLGDYRYRIGYKNSDLKLTVKITPYQDYITIQATELFDPQKEMEHTDYIEIFRIDPSKIPQIPRDKQWAIDSPDTTAMTNFLPVNLEVRTTYDNNGYNCLVAEKPGIFGKSCALVVSQKKDYYKLIERVVERNNLPNPAMPDKQWIRESKNLRDPYMFVVLSNSNYQTLLDYAERGYFKQMLFANEENYGNYSRPAYFSGQDEYFNVLKNFTDRGINIGIHTHNNQINPGSGLINFTNPEISLKEAFYNKYLGKVQQPISGLDSEIVVDRVIGDSSNFSFYSSKEDPFNWQMQFLIDNEIVNCKGYSGNRLLQCSRGAYSTTVSAHQSGSQIYLLPRGDYEKGFFINPNNQKLIQSSIDTLKRISERTNLTFLYFDGFPFPEDVDLNWRFRANNQHRLGVLPYLNALERVPRMQFGSSSSDFSWYYSWRTASWDGTVFKSKEFTKQSKVPSILSANPFRPSLVEMGWWKFFGSNLGGGKEDFDALTFDEIHYAMIKTLVLDSSMGLQLSSYYRSHAYLNELFDLVGVYNRLMEKDIDTGIIPKNVKDYLKDPEKEAELSTVSGYNFIEKKVDSRYSVWDSQKAYSYKFNNPFEKQGINIVIKPRFDYYSFNNPDNKKIINFSDPADNSEFVITTSNSRVICNISGDGTLSIENQGAGIGGCKITLVKDISLINQRGLGFSLRGDNKNELITVQIVERNFGIRDHNFMVNFSGEKELILGNPTADQKDIVNGTDVSWESDRIRRNWNFDYSDIVRASVYINNLQPGESYSLKFRELKGLKEKSLSRIVNPRIKINGQEIVFPVNLSIEKYKPYLLEYNGNTGTYKTYDYNYNNGSLSITRTMSLNKGENLIEFSSDSSSPQYTFRAEVILSVFDDPDSDRIPTNGNYRDFYDPCGNNKNFCDDNCPLNSNPDQKDSDGDGIGDVCESQEPPVIKHESPDGDEDSGESDDGENTPIYGGDDSQESNQSSQDSEEVLLDPGTLINKIIPEKKEFQIIVILTAAIITILTAAVIIKTGFFKKKNLEEEEASEGSYFVKSEPSPANSGITNG